MKNKIFMFMILLLSSVYSVAPSWVNTSASANYTLGSSTVSYTVLNRTDGVINIEIKITPDPGTGANPRRQAENASKFTDDYFWFDASSMASASVGQTIEGYTVLYSSKFTAAGKEWDAITLEKSVGGGISLRRVIDKNSGLLLNQITSPEQPGSKATLAQYYIPGFNPPPPPPASAAAGSSNNSTTISSSTTSPPQQPLQFPNVSSAPPSSTPSSSPISGGIAGNTTVPVTIPSITTSAKSDLEPPSKMKIPCCPVSFIFLGLLVFAIRKRK